MSEAANAAHSSKVISAATIWAQLVHVLDPAGTKGIMPTDPVGDHIKGGPKAVRAFANVLNNAAEFRTDGLDLEPGDMANVAVIGDITAAIIKNYESRGWKVVV
jgi:hypothetical protein